MSAGASDFSPALYRELSKPTGLASQALAKWDLVWDDNVVSDPRRPRRSLPILRSAVPPVSRSAVLPDR